MLSIAIATWLWFRGRWDRLHSNGAALLYFTLLLVLLVSALRIYDGFGLAIFGAYWHGFAFLRIRPAMVYAAILTLLIPVGFSGTPIALPRSTFRNGARCRRKASASAGLSSIARS